jgi:hypothetical protein
MSLDRSACDGIVGIFSGGVSGAGGTGGVTGVALTEPVELPLYWLLEVLLVRLLEWVSQGQLDSGCNFPAPISYLTLVLFSVC